jgi:hypothetical protein
MTTADLDAKAEPRTDAQATLHFTAPWQAEDKLVHSGSYDECKRLLLAKHRVVQENCFIMVGTERFSAAAIVQFGNRHGKLLDPA